MRPARARSGRGDTRQMVAMFRRFTVGQRGSFVGAFVLMVVEAVTAIAVPTLIGSLVSFLKAGSRWQLPGFHPSAEATIPLLAAAVVGVTAVNSLAESVSEVSLAKVGRTLGYNLRTALFAHLQKLSLAFHLRRSTGDVLTRITGDVQALEEFIADSVSDLVGSAMLLVGTLTYLFLKSWRIALLAVIIVPLLALVSNYFARRIKAATREQRAREGDLASTAQEMLTTISVVQAYGRTAHEQRKFAQESRAAMDALLRSSRLEAAFGFAVSVMESVVIAVVVLVGARLVRSDTIDAGLLVAFILLIQGMFKPTRRIIKQWNTVGKVQASVERIGELLDREPAVRDTSGARQAPRLSGAIEFRDVSFAYQPQVAEDSDGEPSALTLRSVSFMIAPGDVVALVGHSGAGKSTIAQLVPRLYDPQAGAVLLDGHDIRSFTIESLRSQISMVLQETILLRGTVAENIAYGREGATAQEVAIAARRAQAHDFITALPKGYDTVLGERAATLSGGQRQRLAIARAFIRDSPILVLDEPTTGLDAQASAAVADALRTLLEGRSAVIVSHDLNLIRGVDRILVLSGGRILEEGTPADLMARGGLYADLYASQFGKAIADLTPDAGVTADQGSAFETVLMDAVPQPASNREFQHLTGWVAAVGRSAPTGPDLSALRSPALARALPGLAEALDPPTMARRLQQLVSRDWVLESCLPGRVFVDPATGATLLYRLRLRQPGTGTVMTHLVAGRLFVSRADAERYLSRLPALAEAARGREELRPFGEVVADIGSLGLVVHAYPLDPDLPGLVEATDPLGMRADLEQAIPSTLEGLTLDSGRVEVTKYRPGEHCVLRYELQWRLPRSNRTVRQVVYGKLFADERGRRIGPLLNTLRGQLQAGAATPAPFLLPRFQSYLPDLRLTLMEALPGTPQARTLVRERVALGPNLVRGPVRAEEVLATCARVAGTLHASAPPSLLLSPSMLRDAQPRTLAGEVARLRGDVEVVASFAPALAEMLHAHLEALAQQGGGESMAPVLCHGDFSPSKILIDGPISSVFDLDSAGAAEPGLDLGHFSAGLAVIARGARRPDSQLDAELAHVLDSAFFAEYHRVQPDLCEDALLERVLAYRTAALLDVALRSWRQLKQERLLLAVRLIQEPYRLVPERARTRVENNGESSGVR